MGSVVRSWLLDLTARALKEDQNLTSIAPYVSDSGEGRWTVTEAIDLDVPAPVITLSLLAAPPVARLGVVHRSVVVGVEESVRRTCGEEDLA